MPSITSTGRSCGAWRRSCAIYYEHTSLLYNLGNTLCDRLCGGRTRRVRWAFLPFRANDRQEIDGFVLEHGELEAVTTTTFGDDPVRLVRVFLLAQQHNAELGAELKLRLRRRLYMINRRFIYQTAVRDTLIAILSRKGQVGRALRTMHELGFLGRFFSRIPAPHLPGAARIFPPLQRRRAHARLHRDARPDQSTPPSRPSRSTAPFSRTRRGPTSSYLAMLLHDTGKSDNSSRHAEASAVNASRSRGACACAAPSSPPSSSSLTIT